MGVIFFSKSIKAHLPPEENVQHAVLDGLWFSGNSYKLYLLAYLLIHFFYSFSGMYDVKSILLSQTSEITLDFCEVSFILQILSSNCVDYPN